MDIKNIEEFKTVINNNQLVLVDFWAEWCGPCRVLTPTINLLKDEEPEGTKVLKIDVTEHADIATEYGIRSIPAVLLYKDGVVIDRLIGVNPKEKYLEMINKNK